jgi:predicted Zn-dependent protease
MHKLTLSDTSNGHTILKQQVKASRNLTTQTTICNKESDMTPPMPPLFIENSMHAGQQFIETFLTANILPATAKHGESQLVWLTEVKSYLNGHNYVITLMDKSLRAAVVSREWV